MGHKLGLAMGLLAAMLPRAVEAQTPATRITTANNQFGFQLFREIESESEKPNGGGTDVNLCISPISITQALGMVFNGASGTTRTAMAKTLHVEGMSTNEINQGNKEFLSSLSASPTPHTPTPPSATQPIDRPLIAPPAPSPASVKPTLDIANSLWIAHPSEIRPAFLQQVKTYYGAEVGSLKGAPQNINAWVDQHTKGKITQIVSAQDIDRSTSAVLVNAVYFKGAWSKPFQPTRTTEKPFHLTTGTTTPCKMMTRDDRFEYYTGDNFQMLRLPYARNSQDMVILLPTEGTSPTALFARLTQETWQQWNDKIVSTPGHVELPRFRTEFSVTLNEPLSSLGMEEAFSRHANFSAMSTVPLYISKVMHKTFMDVNEQGTEAAAATAVTMTRGGIVRPAAPPFQMILNRPFLYAIRDRNTGAVLFIGILNKP